VCGSSTFGSEESVRILVGNTAFGLL